MFRSDNSSHASGSGVENTNDNITTNHFGLNDLNIMGLQGMYLDATSTLMPNIFNAANMSQQNTPLLTPDTTPLSSPTDLTTLQEQHFFNASLLGSALNNAAAVSASSSSSSAVMATLPNSLQRTALLMQHQQQQQQQQYQLQQYRLLQQQQIMQQQLTLANVTNLQQYQQQQQQGDDISHSLKMFAMFSAYNSNNEPKTRMEIMQEFAANGYTSDDLSCQQIQQAVRHSQLAANANQNLPLFKASNAQNQHQLLQTLQTQTWLGLKYPQMRHNMWRNNNTTTNSGNSTTAVLGVIGEAGGSAAKTNNNNNSNSVNGGGNKVPKKQNASAVNREKYITSKHCVFCENNNEPEAVIRSHSVRDMLGRVLCPKLRTYVCPICKASGDSAHTVKYCPKKPIITMEDSVRAESFRLAKSAYFKQQMKV